MKHRYVVLFTIITFLGIGVIWYGTSTGHSKQDQSEIISDCEEIITHISFSLPVGWSEERVGTTIKLSPLASDDPKRASGLGILDTLTVGCYNTQVQPIPPIELTQEVEKVDVAGYIATKEFYVDDYSGGMNVRYVFLMGDNTALVVHYIENPAYKEAVELIMRSLTF